MSDFSQFGLADSLLHAVHEMGFQSATPIQLQAIPVVLEGSDLMGCAQTGTGKTAAFALPILHRLLVGKRQEPKGKPSFASNGKRPGKRGGRQQGTNGRRPIRCLILAPTRELAVQIGKSVADFSRFTELRHTIVYGGVSQWPQVRALQAGVDLLIATPGRLLDLMDQGCIDLHSVESLILDEADQMLDMGFIVPLRKIVLSVPKSRQTLMFSATMPDQIRKLADEWLHHPATVQIGQLAKPGDGIAQSVYFVESQNKPRLLTHFLQSTTFTRTLIFTRTKHGADKIAKQLNRSGVVADAIHGNKSQNARQRTLEAFKSNRLPVLVATDVAARGLDVAGISHVVNYDLPEVPETYVHRIGRTARAGATGIATSFCTQEERSYLRQIERLTCRRLAIEQVQPEYASSSTPEKVPQRRPPQPSSSGSASPRTSRGPKQQGKIFGSNTPGQNRSSRGRRRPAKSR